MSAESTELMPGAVAMPSPPDDAVVPRPPRSSSSHRRSTVFAATSFTAAELESKLATADQLYPWMGRLQLQKLYALFDRWDADCSGSITPHEMKVQMDLYSSLLFDQIDADGSGKLTWDEMRRLTEMLQLSLSEEELRDEWEKMNTNHDDSVDRSEFMAWWDLMENGVSMMDLFARFDVGEQDGKISDTEFINAIALKCENEAGSLDELDADQMVRIALEKVRGDVRAIYGTKTAPSVMLHHMRRWRMEEAASRSCWFSPVSTSSSRFLDYWAGCQAVMLAYLAVVVPFRLAGFCADHVFSDPGGVFFWIDVVVDVSFILDVVFNFRGASRHIDEHTGLLETDPRKIAKLYMQTWFTIDLIACLPIAYFVREGNSDAGAGWKHLRLAKTLRLFQLSKMLKISQLRRTTKRAAMKLNIQGLWTSLRLVAMMLWVMYVAHIVACVWWFLGDAEQVLSDEDTVLYGWRHPIADHHNLPWTEGVSHWSTTYIDCFYFAVTTLTTVGYGDRSAHTDAEKLWVCCVELSGTLIFGVMAGTLTSIISEANELSLRRDRELEDLQTLLNVKGVDKELRKEIVLAMDVMHTREETLVAREHEILAKLPPYYRKMCTRDMYHAQIKCCPLFARAGDQVIDRLISVLMPYLGLPGDEIISQGHLGDEMFLLAKGQVQIFVKDPSHVASSTGQDPSTNRTPIHASAMNGMVFCDGAFFGELPVLGLGNGWLRNQHLYSARALTLAQMCVLRRDDLAAVERDHPALKSSIREMAMERAKRFNIPLNRMTLTVEQQRRRVSISLDDEESIAMVDPDMADALRMVRLHSNSNDGTAAPSTTPFRQSGTDAVLASTVSISSDGAAARVDRDLTGFESAGDKGSGSAEDSKAYIEAVERRLNTQLHGVNEKLDGMARLLESLVAGSAKGSI